MRFSEQSDLPEIGSVVVEGVGWSVIYPIRFGAICETTAKPTAADVACIISAIEISRKGCWFLALRLIAGVYSMLTIGSGLVGVALAMMGIAYAGKGERDGWYMIGIGGALPS